MPQTWSKVQVLCELSKIEGLQIGQRLYIADICWNIFQLGLFQNEKSTFDRRTEIENCIQWNRIDCKRVRMVMFRVIDAPNDILTSFDLWAQIFRIDVEFAADYHGHTQKIFATKLVWFWRNLSKLYQRVTLFAISDEKISKTDIVEQNIRECIKIDTFLFRNKQIIKIKLFL